MTDKINFCAEREPMHLPPRAFECPICFLVLTNPVSCSRCGKMLCERHVADLRECPFCKDTPFKTQVERGVRQLLDELPYPCKYCKSAIPKGNLDVHEVNCPKRLRHCGVAGCEFESCESTDALRHLRGLFHDRNTIIISLVSQNFCAMTYRRV